MKITFAPSFYKSLKRMMMQQTWWYKTYEVFRYNLPNFFRNLWWFRKELYNFRGWDYTHNLNLLSRSLEKTLIVLEKGNEISSSRLKKVEKMRRVIEIIKGIDESNYIDRAQKELGELKNLHGWFNGVEDTPEELEHNRKVIELSHQLEKDEWNELFDILKGKDIEEYKTLYNTLSKEEKKEAWDKWYDGSGMNYWWD